MTLSRRAVPALVLFLSAVAGSGCVTRGAAQPSPSTEALSMTSTSRLTETTASIGPTRTIPTPTTLRPPIILVPPKQCVEITWRPDGGFRCDLPDAVLGFEVGRSDLGPSAREALNPVCDLLIAPRSPWRVALVGHTSPEGDTPEGHQRLSRARAEAVKSYLLGCKVAESQVSSDGVGASQPSPQGPHPESDRRVTVEVLPL